METQSVNTAIELTPIILAVLGGVFAIIRAVAVYYVDKRVHDAQLREVLENAIQNGLGTIQQAASGVIVEASPHLIGVVSNRLAPGVQYVLDHAAEAVARFNISPAAIEEKLISRAGRQEIATNLAATRSSSTSLVVPPLAPSSAVTDATEPNRRELQQTVEYASNGNHR